MAQVINTNIASLNAQRNLNSSQGLLNTALERLSSGLRINSAKDDAAGLAISERMSAQIRGLNQAARNANDGISLAQTAEGALGEIGNNLQRIRELAIQSANATNSAEDRAALQKEVAQLKLEIDRVASQTSFNGTKLLDGNFANQAFQVGANQSETISITSIADAKVASLGSWTSASTYTAASVTGTLSTNGAIAANAFQINGINVGAIADGGDNSGQATNVAAAINAIATQTGVTATASGANITLASSGNTPIVIAGTITNTGLATGTTTATVATAGTAQTGFTGLDISTVGGADNAILAMDAALNAVNSARADLGAIQNRFSSVVANLNTTSENLSASRSRIMDADFAAETAALTRGQILQQAGVAMLAQANALPNNVLSLLR